MLVAVAVEVAVLVEVAVAVRVGVPVTPVPTEVGMAKPLEHPTTTKVTEETARIEKAIQRMKRTMISPEIVFMALISLGPSLEMIPQKPFS